MIELIQYFIKVVQFGSFSRAAENLQVPKSTLSKAVSKLEKQTNSILLVRTTRSLSLTPAGKIFFESCVEPLQKIEEAQKSLYGQKDELAGLIRLTAPEDLGTEVIAPLIAELMTEHPRLSFDLNYSDEVLDLVRDGYDLAVRIGKLSESRLKAKTIGEVNLSLVANSQYLKKNPRLRHPSDLEDHQCLSMKAYAHQQRWSLQSKKGTYSVKIKPRVICNQMTSLLQMAIAGAGVALVPTFLCHRPVEEKKLVYVLPDWKHAGAVVSLVSPFATHSSARLKMVAEKIINETRKSLAK